MTTYNNLPKQVSANSDASTVNAFSAYYANPVQLNASTYDAMKGFFTSRGFNETSAESVTVVIMTQASKDGYNPMRILDSLKGLDNVEISALVSEIVNYNRFKTSYLGYALDFIPNQEINRNIRA